MADRSPDRSFPDTAPNLFTSARWQEVMARTYGFEFREVAGIRFAVVDDALGLRMVAPAFGDYALRCPRESAGIAGLSERIHAVRETFPNASFTFKCAGNVDLPDAQAIRSSFLHEIDPSVGLADAKPAFRRNLAQARRAGLSSRIRTGRQALDAFLELYVRQRLTKFASLPQPRALFDAIADLFFDAGAGFLMEVHLNGQSMAFALALEHEGELYYKFGASDQDRLDLRPNNLLMAALIERAQEMKASRLDLGLTPRDGGLASFKRSMGARESALHTYRWPPLDGSGDDAAGKRELLGEITGRIAASQPSADEASRYGDVFYRYFV